MKNLKWSVLFALSSLLILSACGDKNKSGQSGTESYWGGLNTGTYNGPAPMNTSNPYVQRIFTSLPCSAGGMVMPNQQRMGAGSNYNAGVSFNGVYVGVTVEGDIAVLSSNGGSQSVISIYLCPRPNVNGANLSGPPIAYAASSRGCRVDQITAMDVQVPNLPLLRFFAPQFHPTAPLFQALECR